MSREAMALLIYMPVMVGIFLIFYLLVWEKMQRNMLIFFFYVASSITTSTLYLANNSVFVTETGQYSSGDSAFLLYLLFNTAIALGIGLTSLALSRLDPAFAGPWQMPSREHQMLVGLICLGVCVVEMANVLLSYPNGFSGVAFSRSRFFQDIALVKVLPTLFGVLAFFVPVAGTTVAVAGSSLGLRLVGGASLILYFLYMRGIGQVFHGMLFPGAMVFGIYYALSHKQLAQVRVPIKTLGIAGLVGVILIVADSFSKRGISEYQGGVLAGIVYRILVLQGSASAEIYNLWLRGAAMNAGDLMAGRDWWILHTMPASGSAVFMELGTNLQGAIPGSFLLFGGLFGGALLCLGYGLLIALANYTILKALQRGAWLALFPASYLWVWAVGAYSRASLEEILKLRLPAALLVYLILLATNGAALGQRNWRIMRWNVARPADAGQGHGQ
jgi:hypothetical protein